MVIFGLWVMDDLNFLLYTFFYVLQIFCNEHITFIIRIEQSIILKYICYLEKQNSWKGNHDAWPF